MKRLTTAVLSLLVTLPAFGQQPPPLTPEEEARKEAILKNNPQLREQIEANEKKGLRIKTIEGNKITLDSVTGQKVEPKEAPPPPPPEPPKFIGNADVAEKAYNKGDYKTALENYRALARDGDARATLMVGIMQQQGQGMKQDKAAAYAWYGRAADLGDGTAKQIVKGMNDNDELSRKEQTAAAKQYEAISKEFDKPDVAADAGKRFENVQSQTQVNSLEFAGQARKSLGPGENRATRKAQTYHHPPAKTANDKDLQARTYSQPSDD